MNIEKILEEIIPPSDYQHRNGFNNIPLIDKLTGEEKIQLENALIDRLTFESDKEPDSLIVETLAYLKSQKSLPVLRQLLEKDLYEITKLVIATSIYEINRDDDMIDIAIDVIKKIEQKKGAYYIYKLTKAFYYLIKFDNAEINSIIEEYTSHKEYLIASNAKEVLGYAADKFKKSIQEAEIILSDSEKRLSKTEQQPIDLNLIDTSNYVESLKKMVKEIRGPEYEEISRKIYSLLEDLFNVYLVSSVEQRKMIEKLFQNKEYILNHLVSFPSHVSNFIHSPKDIKWLEIGLVSALIVDGRVDFRDLFISLGTLYIKAKEKGIDPYPHFNRIESLVLSDDSYNSINIDKSILSNFLNSEYLNSITNPQ